MVVAFNYIVTVLIWGATWIAMKYQIGTVAIEVSIVYRFALAGALLWLFLFMTKRLQWIAIKHQPFVILQALCLFCCNFICIYIASYSIASGMVSVVFSMATVLNIINAFLLYRRRPTWRVLSGACLGVIGISGLFWETLSATDFNAEVLKGLFFALLGTWFFSLGNFVSARNQAQGLSLTSVNAWGMLYAAAIMTLVALVRGLSFNFEPSVEYISALLYLAIPGSLIGYTLYLRVVHKLGPEKAAYITVLFPIVALMISVFFEGYKITPLVIAGLGIILLGNILVLYKSTAKSAS